MVRELCKWDYELRNGEQLEAVIDRAIEIATSEPCGPVYLSLPREVMCAKMTSFTFAARPRRGLRHHPRRRRRSRSHRAADIIAAAERPVIFARENARVAGNATALADFVERFALPLVEYRALANSIPTDMPMHAGFDPLPHLREADADPQHRDRRAVDPDRPRRSARRLQGDPARRRSAVRAPADPQLPVRSGGDRDAARGAAADRRGARPAASRPRRSPRAAPRPPRRTKRARRRRKRSSPRARKATPIQPAWAAHCIAQAKDDDAIVVNEYSLILRHAPFPQAAHLSRHADGGRARLGRGRGDRRQARGTRPARHRDARRRRLHVRQSDRRRTRCARALQPADPVHRLQQRACGRRSKARRCASSPTGTPRAATACRSRDLGPIGALRAYDGIYGGYGECVDTPEALPGALERALHAVRVEKRQALLNLIVGPRGGAP